MATLLRAVLSKPFDALVQLACVCSEARGYARKRAAASLARSTARVTLERDAYVNLARMST
eukprot:3939113-Rhodomonas_salina.2